MGLDHLDDLGHGGGDLGTNLGANLGGNYNSTSLGDPDPLHDPLTNPSLGGDANENTFGSNGNNGNESTFGSNINNDATFGNNDATFGNNDATFGNNSNNNAFGNNDMFSSGNNAFGSGDAFNYQYDSGSGVNSGGVNSDPNKQELSHLSDQAGAEGGAGGGDGADLLPASREFIAQDTSAFFPYEKIDDALE
jgi:hypothetical protein